MGPLASPGGGGAWEPEGGGDGGALAAGTDGAVCPVWGAVSAAGGAIGLPQCPQKRKPGSRGRPQASHTWGPGAVAAAGALSGCPQSRQKAKLASFSRPHLEHLRVFAMVGPFNPARPGPVNASA